MSTMAPDRHFFHIGMSLKFIPVEKQGTGKIIGKLSFALLLHDQNHNGKCKADKLIRSIDEIGWNRAINDRFN